MKYQYIGDGLYASYDGWQLELKTSRDGVNEERVYLEPEVFLEFLRYVYNNTNQKIILDAFLLEVSQYEK